MYSPLSGRQAADMVFLRYCSVQRGGALSVYERLRGRHVGGLVLRRSRVVEAVAGPGAPPLAAADAHQQAPLQACKEIANKPFLRAKCEPASSREQRRLERTMKDLQCGSHASYHVHLRHCSRLTPDLRARMRQRRVTVQALNIRRRGFLEAQRPIQCSSNAGMAPHGSGRQAGPRSPPPTAAPAESTVMRPPPQPAECTKGRSQSVWLRWRALS